MRHRPPILLWLLSFMFLRRMLGHRHHHGWAPYGYERGWGHGFGGRHRF